MDVSYTVNSRPVNINYNGYAAAFGYNDNYDRTTEQITQGSNTLLSKTFLAGGKYEVEASSNGDIQRLYLDGSPYTASVVLEKAGGAGAQLYYLHRDYLGSVTQISDNNGNLAAEYSYDAWGRMRNVTTWQPYAQGSHPMLKFGRGYTGHEHLTVFGLINMNARLYDPALGRFLSPDPYVQSPDNSQNFNRYSYCLNNPLRYSDPTGMLTWNDVFGGISLIAGIVLEFIPGMQGLGTSLIVAGFSHFAYTIDQMQNSNMNWNQASNSAGFQFSTTIDINGPTTKEKNHSNGNSSVGSMTPNIKDYPDSRFFQGSDYDAAELSVMLSKHKGVEVSYYATPMGYYFEQTSGYMAFKERDIDGESCYLYNNNTTKSSYAYTYQNNGYLYDIFSNPQIIYYVAHTHPLNSPVSIPDAIFSGEYGYPVYAIGYNGNITGAFNYNVRIEMNLNVRNLSYNTLRNFKFWSLLNPSYIIKNGDE